MSDTRRKAAEEWVREHPLHVSEIEPVDAHLAGQERIIGKVREAVRIASRRWSEWGERAEMVAEALDAILEEEP